MFSHAPASRETNDTLYPLVVAGNEKAIEEMILGNMALVTFKVAAYLQQFYQFSYLKDDMLSQGYLGLCMAVRSMVNNPVENPNPTGLISINIHYQIGELLDIEAAIRVPKRTWHRKNTNGQPLAVPKKEGSLTVEDTLQMAATEDPRAMTILMDELMGCCENDTEKELVKLRTEGRKDDEIAGLLGLPKTTTYMMRRGIYARFLERNPEVTGEV